MSSEILTCGRSACLQIRQTANSLRDLAELKGSPNSSADVQLEDLAELKGSPDSPTDINCAAASSEVSKLELLESQATLLLVCQ